MKIMNILYYHWGEITYIDAVESFKNLGIKVSVSGASHKSYDFDEEFMCKVSAEIEENSIDAIFSFNYFPDLSRISLDKNILYLSWCYDSPHLTLYSNTITNSCNRIFLFDYSLCQYFWNKGISNVIYLPLACNVSRVCRTVEKQRRISTELYMHEISFVGNMYDKSMDFISQINYLPEYLRGYLDAVIEAQIPIFGMDMVNELLKPDICAEIFKYVNLSLGEEYYNCSKEILSSMIHKRITNNERSRILTVLGELYNLDHYATEKAESIPVNYLGYADYTEVMPWIFASSKINLNITLRSILSGIPLRVVDILGAGGFCITNFQSEMVQFFDNDNSIVWYESYEELFEKVAFYLKNDAERSRISVKGQDIIRNEFSYDCQIRKIVSEI